MSASSVVASTCTQPYTWCEAFKDQITYVPDWIPTEETASSGQWRWEVVLPSSTSEQHVFVRHSVTGDVRRTQWIASDKSTMPSQHHIDVQLDVGVTTASGNRSVVKDAFRQRMHQRLQDAFQRLLEETRQQHVRQQTDAPHISNSHSMFMATDLGSSMVWDRLLIGSITALLIDRLIQHKTTDDAFAGQGWAEFCLTASTVTHAVLQALLIVDEQQRRAHPDILIPTSSLAQQVQHQIDVARAHAWQEGSTTALQKRLEIFTASMARGLTSTVEPCVVHVHADQTFIRLSDGMTSRWIPKHRATWLTSGGVIPTEWLHADSPDTRTHVPRPASLPDRIVALFPGQVSRLWQDDLLHGNKACPPSFMRVMANQLAWEVLQLAPIVPE